MLRLNSSLILIHVDVILCLTSFIVACPSRFTNPPVYVHQNSGKSCTNHFRMKSRSRTSRMQTADQLLPLRSVCHCVYIVYATPKGRKRTSTAWKLGWRKASCSWNVGTGYTGCFEKTSFTYYVLLHTKDQCNILNRFRDI